MAVLAVVQSAAVSTAQPTGGELLEPAPADAVGENASIHVSHIEAFAVDGGEAIFEPGTEYEEAFSYDSVDTEEALLVGLTRTAPIDHPEGAFVQAVMTAEPSASPSPSPNDEPVTSPAPAAPEQPTATEDAGPSTSSNSAVGEPCGGSCVDEVTTFLGETVNCTGTSEDPVGCEVTAVPNCDGAARTAIDDSCIQEVDATLCGLVTLYCNWPPEPTTIHVEELAGPQVEYGLRVPDISYQIPDAALPGDLNLFSVSPGVPFDPDYPTEAAGGGSRDAGAADGSRACTYTSTSYREGYVGEGDDGLSGADDELGAHTATRASSGPFGINASYREANAWTRAGVALGVRLRSTSAVGVTVTYPWNTLGEIDITEGGGRQASGSAWFRIKILDYTSCPDNATSLNGCASVV